MSDTVETQPTKDPGAEDSGPDAAQDEAVATVEAVLFATDSPLPPAKIAKVAELPGVRPVRQAIEALNERYAQMGCAFRIEEIAGGYQMLTLPQYHDVLERLLQTRRETKLSQAAMETLAIVAYRQPILRADVEAIRGVSCGEVLRTLMDRQLVKIVGRAEVLGRPMLYGTTRRFLEVFGISKLEDLPRVEELRESAKQAGLSSPQDVQPPAAEDAGDDEAASEEPEPGEADGDDS